MSDVGQAPLGAEPVSQEPVQATTPAPNVSATPAEPTPIKLTPDSMVDIDGKPVKFSDHVRGFQAQATKASQRAAELERQLRERDAALQRYQSQQQPQQNQAGPGQQIPLISQLESLPYLSGKEAAGVVNAIVQEFNQRDQIVLALAKQVKTLQDVIKPIYETNATSAFEQKINGFLKAGNHPDDFKDLAAELYLGYEPSPELDEQFPQILAQRIQQVQAALERRRRQEADEARRKPFVPGKGGNAHPSKPLTLRPSNSARDDAEALWESIQAGSGT